MKIRAPYAMGVMLPCRHAVNYGDVANNLYLYSLMNNVYFEQQDG